MFDEIQEYSGDPEIQLPEDILDQLFQYLPNTALGRCAQVCKLWYEVAQREMSKTCLHHVWMKPYVHQHKDFVRKFKVKPNTSLFFCASRPETRNADNIDYATLYQYHHQFPYMGQTIVLGVERAMLDTTEISSCYDFPRGAQKGCSPNGVLGINFAERKDMTVKIAWCDSNEETSLQDAQRCFEQLQPNENVGEPIYLMFGRRGISTAKNVLTLLRERYKDGQPNVWGGTMADFVKCNDSYPKKNDLQLNGDRRWTSKHGFLGILLQSSRFRAHTMIASIDDDLTARLIEFKEKFLFRKHSLGLVCGPHSIPNVYTGKDTFVYKTVMETLKQQFPKVTFTGYFNEPNLQYYGCDNKDADVTKPLLHERTISIMILTHD